MKKHSKIKLWANHGSTILSITLVLLLLGLLMILEYHSYRQTHDIQEQITIRVDLMPETTDSSALILKQRVANLPNVKQVDYISRDEAAKIFTLDLGDDFVDFLGYNPLSPSLMVNLTADLLPENNTKTIDDFKSKVSSWNDVEDVAYQETVVTELHDIYYKLSWFLIFFICLLLILCVILISSTIRIALYAQRDTIRSMRMVGAKVAFIARPFVLRAFLYGFIGAILASLLSLLVLWLFNNRLSLGIVITDHYIWYSAIAAVLILIGISITWLSTVVTVRRYIRQIDKEN